MTDHVHSESSKGHDTDGNVGLTVSEQASAGSVVANERYAAPQISNFTGLSDQLPRAIEHNGKHNGWKSIQSITYVYVTTKP
jgi:hypothetical protein